jgi:hypothetical protein
MTHISFSALKIWNDCPHKYKLVYVDKLQKFKGSEHTAFGTALHEACEKKVLDNNINEVQVFEETFKSEVDTIFSESPLDQKIYDSMIEQGRLLAPLVLPALKQHFGEIEILSAEEDIYENIPNFGEDYKFKGFIDLIIKTSDGKIHILDYKTTSWGWGADKKSDAMLSYQLTFYKYFYAQKHNVSADNIETHFCLLKRTAKKDNVEIFRVTSGPKKTSNAFNILNNGIHNIQKGFYPKNKLNCTYCEFKKTKECP